MESLYRATCSHAATLALHSSSTVALLTLHPCRSQEGDTQRRRRSDEGNKGGELETDGEEEIQYELYLLFYHNGQCEIVGK